MIQNVAIEKLKPGDNYRKIVNQDELDELVASVKEKGILQPLIVRKLQGDYEIVVGFRRYLAGKAAKLKELPVDVRELSDKEAFELSIIENVQRANPHLIDEAHGFKKALELGEHTMDTLTQVLGKKPAYVMARLRLAGLPASIQKFIVDKKLGVGHAVLFSRLRSEADMKAFAKALSYGTLPSIQNAQEMIERSFGHSLKNAPFETVECVECPARSGTCLTLFPEIKDKDQCTDPACYLRKMKDYFKPMIEQWKRDGKKVITKEGEYKALDAERHTMHLELPGFGKLSRRGQECLKKCADCTELSYYVVEAVDYQGKKDLAVGIICPSQQCYYKRDTLTTPSSGTKVTRENSHSQIMHAKDCRNRFLWSVLPERVRKTKTLELRLAIYQILRHNNAISDDKKRYFQKYAVPTKNMSLYRAIMAIPDKKLEEALKDAVIYSLRYTSPSVLIQAAPEAKVDLKADFTMDERYLQTRTKDQLVTIGNSMKVSVDPTMKKGTMVVAILSGKLKGVVPKDIASELKPESYEGYDGDLVQGAIEGAVVTFSDGIQEGLKAKK